MTALNAEMFARVPGNTPLVIGADPVEGWVIFQNPSTDPPTELFRVSAVQAEQVLRLVTMAKYIVESGIGDMGGTG